MKKKTLFLAVYILAFAVTFINLFFSFKESNFFNINDLPKGKLSYSVNSPKGDSTLNIYRIENKIGVALRGELKTNKSVSNIFWQTGIKDAKAFWLDENVVSINGVMIDAEGGGFYDCRRGISLFQEGSVEGEKKNE